MDEIKGMPPTAATQSPLASPVLARNPAPSQVSKVASRDTSDAPEAVTGGSRSLVAMLPVLGALLSFLPSASHSTVLADGGTIRF